MSSNSCNLKAKLRKTSTKLRATKVKTLTLSRRNPVSTLSKGSVKTSYSEKLKMAQVLKIMTFQAKMTSLI